MSSLSDAIDSRLDTNAVLLRLLENMIWPILAIVVLGIALLVPQTFRNFRSLEVVLYGAVPLGLLVLAEGLTLLSGNFDLSIGAVAGFSAMFTGMILGTCASCWGLTADPLIGFAIIFLVSGTIGMVNGIMISKFNINPFLQTLSFLIIFEGAKTALNTQPISGLPSAYVYPGGDSFVAIGLLLLVFALVGVVLRYTTFGQAILAVGSDEESAREVGINTDRVIIAVFTLSGLLAGLAGLMLTGFVGVVPPSIGEGMVFQAFAGAVIGGISLFGGRGKVSGALGGVILLAIIEAALNISGVEATQVQMANGIILLFAIVLYNMKESIRTRILARGDAA